MYVYDFYSIHKMQNRNIYIYYIYIYIGIYYIYVYIYIVFCFDTCHKRLTGGGTSQKSKC